MVLNTATTIAKPNLSGTAHNKLSYRKGHSLRHTHKSKNITNTRKPNHVFRSRLDLSPHILTCKNTIRKLGASAFFSRETYWTPKSSYRSYGEVVGHIPKLLVVWLTKFLKRPTNSGKVVITGRWVNRGGGYSLKLPCEYENYYKVTYFLVTGWKINWSTKDLLYSSCTGFVNVHVFRVSFVLRLWIQQHRSSSHALNCKNRKTGGWCLSRFPCLACWVVEFNYKCPYNRGWQQ